MSTKKTGEGVSVCPGLYMAYLQEKVDAVKATIDKNQLWYLKRILKREFVILCCIVYSTKTIVCSSKRSALKCIKNWTAKAYLNKYRNKTSLNIYFL